MKEERVKNDERKRVKQKNRLKNNEKCFFWVLFFCEKKVKSERINKEFHEEFQNKNDYFAHK